MKKLFICCQILFIGFSNAQIPKSVTFISGQIGYSTTKDNSTGSKAESFQFVPTVGYFFAPNWVMAGSLGYKTEISEMENRITPEQWQSSRDVSSAMIIIPSLRKFWVLDDKFSLFGQLDFPLEFGKIKNETETTSGSSTVIEKLENNYFSYGISVKPGIDYALNPRWKIAATLGEIGYTSAKKESVEGTKNKLNFGLSLSSVNFGLKYILPRKK